QQLDQEEASHLAGVRGGADAALAHTGRGAVVGLGGHRSSGTGLSAALVGRRGVSRCGGRPGSGLPGRPPQCGQEASMAPLMLSTMVFQALAGSLAWPETISASVVPQEAPTRFVAGSAATGTPASPAAATPVTSGSADSASAAAVRAGTRPPVLYSSSWTSLVPT